MSAGPPHHPTGSFSLFPKDRPPSRSQNNTPGRPSMDSVPRDSPPRAGRYGSLERKISVRDGKNPATVRGPSRTATPDASNAGERWTSRSPSETRRTPDPIIQRPAPMATTTTTNPPQRYGTAVSKAQTLVQTNSNRSRSSIAKPPLSGGDEATAGTKENGEASGGSAPLRSIFPEYNPNVPLQQQNYYPPQTSPTPDHLPAGAVSRHLYSPTSPSRANENDDPVGQNVNSPMRSPMSADSSRTHQGATTRKWPPARVNVKPTVPETSSTEQIRDFWKVANGWRAPASEGRVYTFKMTGERDAPVYTLSSKTQPLYRMRLDPTSASAYVSLSRFDPSKPYKPPPPPKDTPPTTTITTTTNSNNNNNNNNNGSGETVDTGKSDSATKGWQEVLSTTLEETSRHHATGGGDGLVALLYPLAAAKLAVDSRYTNANAFATAERECARLVWDDDSGSHFLVHPALAMPFRVSVERNPTWSRTEYTLEHIESPQHLARLTRDGTGAGWVEVDTGIASKIEAVYLVDVAVAALMLVAHNDGDFSKVEVFEPPPAPQAASGRNSRQDKRASRISRMSGRKNSDKGDKKKPGSSRMEEFELDLESQASDAKKHSGKDKDKDELPGVLRAVISVLSVTFKCLIWCATVAFKALTGMISLFARCVGVTSQKL